jgi:hypothetical protein
MTADQVISILNLITLATWLPLVFLPRRRWATTLLLLVVPSLPDRAARDVYQHRVNKVLVHSMAEFCYVLDTSLAIAIVVAVA